MKRKVIQIAESTHLISLPKAWTRANNVKKGDELEVDLQGPRLVVRTLQGDTTEATEFDLSGMELMTSRFLHALYKRGIDEVTLKFPQPETLELIKNSLGKETVGYEITDQSRTSCIVRNVSGELAEFDAILRRTFLLLNTLAKDTHTELSTGNFQHIGNVALLEEANNRFTTSLRRSLNKRGSERFDKVGPIYYVLEELEHLADNYKYLCSYMAKQKPAKLHAESLSMLADANAMVDMFYRMFYKFDRELLEKIGKGRKDLVKRFYHIVENQGKGYGPLDTVIAHHALNIGQRVFCLTGPYLVLMVGERR